MKFWIALQELQLMKISKLIKKAIRKEKRDRKRRMYYNPPTTKQYIKRYLLTNNEYNFYCKIKSIADKYNLQILAKIRLADLIEPDTRLSKQKYAELFEKIKALHIDFAISDDMKIVCLIELDDKTHEQPDRIKRDNFIDTILYDAEYNLIHTHGETEEIEYFIKEHKKKGL